MANPSFPVTCDLGRAAHRAQRLVELVLAVGMAVHEGGEIACAEGRLVLGDRLQRHGRLGDDLRAVLPRDAPMIGRALGVVATRLAPRTSGTALMLWFEVKILRFEAAVIEAAI